MDRVSRRFRPWTILAAAGLLFAGVSWAQVPVDEDGNPLDAEAIGEAGEAAAAPALSAEDLEALVGPIALYPDDLLAVVLPASAYPLQIVQAARFLEELEDDAGLEPDAEWDDSVTALLNYPEVIEMMNEDLDWTYELGEAVVRQQADVVAAIEAFRDRAYAAGNLKSDERQTVSRDNGVIEIEPVEEDIIYVPYYEPERVVVYQPRPVYHYYARPYPVYYYPYPHDYSFFSGYFWGVTTAFRIGWLTDHVHVLHHSYWGHPYYGHHYFGHWYRRPSIFIYNRYYVNNHVHRPPHHQRDGDFWRPRRHGGGLIGRPAHREAYYSDRRRERSEEGYRDARDGRSANAGRDRARPAFRGDTADGTRTRDVEPGFARARPSGAARRADRNGSVAERSRADEDGIRFRPREQANVAGRAAGEDRAIRFRPRADRGESVARQTEREPVERAQRATPRAEIERPSIDRSPRPTVRERAASPRPRVSSPRRTAPAPRASTPRATAPRASTPRTSTPRATAPRASTPRASTPRATAPRASTPRASTPRAAPSRPSASSPRAPSRASRAAPRRAEAASSSSGARRRTHQR